MNATSTEALSQDLVEEISSGAATVTPWWFAVKTYLKVSPFPREIVWILMTVRFLVSCCEELHGFDFLDDAYF